MIAHGAWNAYKVNLVSAIFVRQASHEMLLSAALAIETRGDSLRIAAYNIGGQLLTTKGRAELIYGPAMLTGGMSLGVNSLINATTRTALAVAQTAKTGQSLAAAESAGAETYYRTMSQTHYEQLLATGKLPATAETFISPSLNYARQYAGVTVQFALRGGTTDSLLNIGVRNAGLGGEMFESLPLVQKGWTSSNAFFKLEGDVINVGLGRGTALETFNNNILTFGLPK
jgi:hypothetical protein